MRNWGEHRYARLNLGGAVETEFELRARARLFELRARARLVIGTLLRGHSGAGVNGAQGPIDEA